MDAFVDAINGGVGSAVSKVSTYPLDLIKTRLAVGDKDANVQKVVNDLTEKDGIAGLYKGIKPKLVKSVTGKVLYFYIYRSLLDGYKSVNNTKSVGTLANLVIGYLGEALELPVIMPLEAVVSRVQTSTTDESGVEVAKKMYKEGGIESFYVSLDAYLIGALQPAIQFTIYDQIRSIFEKIQRKKGRSTQMSTFQAFVLGVIASSIATTTTYPVEMVRTVVQSRSKVDSKGESNGLIDVAKSVLQREGILGLFKGLGPNLAQAVLSAALMLAVKERITRVTRSFLYWLLGMKKSKQL